jgi:anion-transporting  ArsA/GET3 family ATPase
MYDGFVERARAVTRTLEDKRTTFVVVSTLESAPAREAEFFIDALSKRDFNLGAVILNKVLPEYLLDPRAAAIAARMASDGESIAGGLDPTIGSVDDVSRVLMEIGESFLNYRVVAQREAEQAAELGQVPELVMTVPYFDRDITDLGGLLELGAAVWR